MNNITCTSISNFFFSNDNTRNFKTTMDTAATATTNDGNNNWESRQAFRQ